MPILHGRVPRDGHCEAMPELKLGGELRGQLRVWLAVLLGLVLVLRHHIHGPVRAALKQGPQFAPRLGLGASAVGST